MHADETALLPDESLAVAQQRFEGLVLALINADDARERLHFKYIGPEWLDAPGWYFWPKNRRGVYFLRLESAAGSGPATDGRFALCYYPHPDEEVFAAYSLIEQLARVSDLFSRKRPEHIGACCCRPEQAAGDLSDLGDGLGIPVPEKRAALKPWLYSLGTVTCRWEGDRLRRCEVEAPFRSCTWAFGKTAVADGQGNDITVLDRHDLDRNLPAWELCRFFTLGFLDGLGLLDIRHRLERASLGSDPCSICAMTFALD
jgi:hypothetical protein